MFGIEKKYIDFIIDVLNKSINNNAKYYIYGSRAKGSYKQYSDIDIAIDNETEIPANVIAKISADFENSTLPWKVDVIDLNSIDENFKKLIRDDLKKIN